MKPLHWVDISSGKHDRDMYTPLNPDFIYIIIEKLGFTGGLPIFAPKHRLWVRF